MNMKRTGIALVLVVGAGLLSGGCPEDGVLVPFNVVRVELVNDTDHAVDPNIRYDDDNGFLAGLFPAESLESGLLQAGDYAVFNFDCDELGSIASHGAEQVTLFGTYEADSSKTFERDDDYDCGDLIEFRFVGEGEDFGVVVSINGRVVD